MTGQEETFDDLTSEECEEKYEELCDSSSMVCSRTYHGGTCRIRTVTLKQLKSCLPSGGSSSYSTDKDCVVGGETLTLDSDYCKFAGLSEEELNRYTDCVNKQYGGLGSLVPMTAEALHNEGCCKKKKSWPFYLMVIGIPVFVLMLFFFFILRRKKKRRRR